MTAASIKCRDTFASLIRNLQQSFTSKFARLTIFCSVMLLATTQGRAADIGFVVDPDGVVDGLFDQFWVDRLESQGHNVLPLPVDYNPKAGDAADADIFIVSNDIGSGDFVAGGVAPEVEFFDFEGSFWFGGGDLDAGFAGGPPRLFHLNPVDISGHNNVQMTISLAARPTGWDEGIDFVAFSANTNGDNTFETELADFQPNFDGDLEDTISETVLIETFEDLTIPIPQGDGMLRLQIDAFSTATGEQFGMDNIRITGSNGAVTIATENFEGGADQIGFTVEGRGGAGAAFWDLVNTEGGGVSPRLTDPRPIITYETAIYDELGLSETGERFDGGTIDIEDPDHPLAAGLSGSVEIYEFDQGISELGDPEAPGTQVVATHFDAPVIAVLEAGAEDRNGDPAAGQRIAIFAHDGGDGDLYTEAGLALLDASVAYALSSGANPGDFDKDGDLDVDDVNALIGEIVRGSNDGSFNLNDDALVNSDDLNVWVKDLRNTWFGDANLDGEFNSGDFVEVFQAGKFEQDVEAGWHEGDWNGDHRFGSSDFVKAFQDGGFEQGPRVRTSAVPEPSGLVLLIVGLCGLSVRGCFRL